MVIVDTSCLVTLERSGDFDILEKVFGEINITPEIENEFGKDFAGVGQCDQG